MEVDVKYIHRWPNALWIDRRQNMSNKILPGKSNKSLLPDFRENWDTYLAIAVVVVITVMCVISVIQMYWKPVLKACTEALL